ncbi:MAG: Hsp20/alpha crystallin family protein [Polyangiaceae bacterium]|jgi:HSP20 family protein
MLTGWRDFDDTLRALSLIQRRIDHVFEDWNGGVPAARGYRTARAAWPPVNAFETKDSFVYKIEVPGLAESDVSVYVEEESLVLRGERKSQVPEGYEVRLREREPVAFTRKLPLPGRVDGETVTASMKDGILTVTLPKAKETLPRQIEVKVQ